MAAVDALMTKFDARRIHSYANNLLDYHAIMDLVPHRTFSRVHIDVFEPRKG